MPGGDDRYMKANRLSWDARTPTHFKSRFYDVDGFKAGKSSLNSLEIDEMGDIGGKRLLHLQCHFGMDTMSWARLGAKVTCVDFSAEAISRARSLSDELGIDAEFVVSNVYDLPDALDEQFDVVFTSYGVLNWLPDIAGWAEVVSDHLKPGGVFYIVEFHPFAAVFEASEAGDMVPTYGYFHHELFFEGGDPSYAGEGIIETPTYQWQHSLGDIVSALVAAGLRIEFLHEFPFNCYQLHPAMERGDDGWWRLPKHNESFPQMFSIRATR